MAKAKKKDDDALGQENYRQYVEQLTEKSPDGKFSTYETFQGEGLDGHRDEQQRGDPKKTA